MSRIIIPPYRVLKTKTFETIFPNKNGVEINYFYESLRTHKRCELVKKGTSANNMYLEDPNFEWNPQDQKLNCKISIEIHSPTSLFSPIVGVATPSSKLGVAVIWRCKESKARGSVSLDNLEITENSIERYLETEFSIEPGILIGKINFTFVIYLKSYVPCEKSFGFATIPGTILGIIDNKDIYIDGNGSMFPILDEVSNSKLLWRTEISFDDLTETFDEYSFCLYFNKNHEDYECLVTKNKNKHSQLFKEVLAQALFDFIEYARSRDDQFIDNLEGDFEDGSIGRQLKFFINVCQWKLETSHSTLNSIRNFIEEKF